MSPARVALADLSNLPSTDRLIVSGRVVHAGGGRIVLADAWANAEIQGGEELAPGDVVQLTCRWDGSDLQCLGVASRTASSRSPFGPEAEHSRLLGDGRRVLRNLHDRARILRVLRDALDARGFLEVETPLSVPSPGLDVHLDAMGVQWGGAPRYLITSPEYQMKRLLAGGLERIYQLCKCFRNDEIGSRHQPEFSMLEWYRAHAGMADMMTDTESLVAEVATAIHGRPVVRAGEREIDVTPPWPRITLRDAFQRFAGISMDEVLPDEDRFFELLVDKIEPSLEQMGAVFLCEYPASMASLARKKPGDPSVAERFEAYVGGLELCNGFGELTCPVEQRQRLLEDQRARRERELPEYPIDERFVAALEEGVPPSGGNALGVDRLIMLILGADHIEDVLAVPASRL